MKRVFRGRALPEVGHLKSLLEDAGIRCHIKNEQLGAALGEIPFLECTPELWVLEDGDERAAARLIGESIVGAGTPITGAAWRCRRCGGDNEPQFAACWQCGTHDPAS
jgi:hypothetical protein